MRKVEDEIKDILWARVEGPLAYAVVRILESRKPKSERGAAMIAIVRSAFASGLDTGYDMAASIFAPEELTDDTPNRFGEQRGSGDGYDG